MEHERFALDLIEVASPCTVPWQQMHGDDNVRFCDQCQLLVYNLSAIDRPAAEALLRRHTGSLCVRYFRRADGTILTQDCPVGRRTLHRRLLRRMLTAVALVGSLLLGSGRAFAWSSATRCIRWLEGEPVRVEKPAPPSELTVPSELLQKPINPPLGATQGRIKLPEGPPRVLPFPPRPAGT